MANSRAMEVIEMLREGEGVSKSAMNPQRGKYYDHLEAKDIKVGTFLEYLRILGYEVVITKRGTRL